MSREGLHSDNATAVNEAQRLLAVRRCDEALARLGPVLASDPSDAAAHRLAAACYFVLKDMTSAESHARAAMAADLNDPQAAFTLAVVEKRLGHQAAAEEAAAESIRRAPERATGYLAMAQVCQRDRSTVARAREAAGMALNMQPSDPDALVLAAQTYMYNGRRRVPRADREAARGYLQRALELAPSNVEARYEVATLIAFSGHPFVSIRELGDVLRTDPLHQRAHERLRHVLRKLTLRSHVVAFALLTALAALGELRPGRIVVAAFAVATAAWLVHGLRAGLRSSLAPTLRDWAATAPGFALWFLLVLIALAAVVVTAAAPIAWSHLAEQVGWFALLAGAAAGLMRRRP